MPVFVLTLPQLITVVTGTFTAAFGAVQWADGKSLSEIRAGLGRIVADWIVSYAASKAGLVLLEDDPLSDASFCSAIFERTGITIRTLKDKAMIAEDIDEYAAAMLSQKIGYQISSLRDPAKAKADLEAAGLQVLSVKTGIPFSLGLGGALDADAIRGQVKDWAKAEMSVALAGDANALLSVLGGAGADFQSLAATINGKLLAQGSGESVSHEAVAMYVAESLARDSVRQFGKTVASLSKTTRRALQVRQAQQKFRSVHGNRQKYVPLGMAATIA